jgi:hypothetical protein
MHPGSTGFAIAWTAPARGALARRPGKVATAAVEFLYGPPVCDPPGARVSAEAACEILHKALPRKRHGLGCQRYDDPDRCLSAACGPFRTGLGDA